MLGRSFSIAAWTRAPAVHFLALGAVLFVVSTRTGGSAVRPPIIITAERVAEIRDDYQRNLRTVPTPAELDALVAREAEEEMLYREALLLGLDRGDRAVEWRVIEKVHFLYGDAAGDNAQALKRGLALGLEREDIVVRNALLTKIRLLAKAASRADEPSGPALERELDGYLEHHRTAYAQSERLSLTHIFLSADKRGASLDDDARDVLTDLRESGARPESRTKLGDAFVAGSAFRSTSTSELAKIFGDGFAGAVSRLEPGRWSEPVRSPYGLHLVWVAGHDAAAVPALDAVRPRVLRAYRAERRSRYLTRMVDELRTAYEVRIEHAAHTL
jgi:hypothetical protein